MFNLMIEQANRHAGLKKSKNWFSIWQENCKKNLLAKLPKNYHFQIH